MRQALARWWSRSRADRNWRHDVTRYFLLGLFMGWVAQEWRIFSFGIWLVPVVALLTTVMGLTRLRVLAWVAAGAQGALLLVMGWTPAALSLIERLHRADAPTNASAIVVLGTGGAMLQERVTRASELAAQGRADVIVLTQLNNPAMNWDVWVTEQLRTLRLRQEVALVGPVVNTHDEALAVAKLARARGWGRVILVTHAWHMPRAAAVFEKAGVRVVCVPCRDGRLGPDLRGHPRERVALFGDWLRETVGTWVYARRGWI